MSKTISVETTINAPLNKVWDEVSQIQNHSNWTIKSLFESKKHDDTLVTSNIEHEAVLASA